MSSTNQKDCILIYEEPTDKNNKRFEINNFSQTLNYLYSKKGRLQLNFPKKKINNQEHLTLKCYEKNNNIILEFIEEAKALLFMNNMNKNNLNIDQKKIFIINYQNYEPKSVLFDIILSTDEESILNMIEQGYAIPYLQYISNKQEKNKNIFVRNYSYDRYINNNVNNNRNKNGELVRNKSNFNKICSPKIFIYIYYYEKSLNEKAEDIFNESRNFYLINHEDLQKFKASYNYKEIYNYLKNKINKNNNINYNNLDQYIDHIYKWIRSNETNNYFKQNVYPFKFNDYSLINNNNNQILINNKCFIYDKKIIDMVNINPNLISKKVFIKDKFIYAFDNIYLYIGYINDNLLFSTKYYLAFNSSSLLNAEMTFIKSSLIENYIKYRKCHINMINGNQSLKDNDKIIGNLIIIGKKENNNMKKDYKIEIINCSKKICFDKNIKSSLNEKQKSAPNKINKIINMPENNKNDNKEKHNIYKIIKKDKKILINKYLLGENEIKIKKEKSNNNIMKGQNNINNNIKQTKKNNELFNQNMNKNNDKKDDYNNYNNIIINSDLESKIDNKKVEENKEKSEMEKLKQLCNIYKTENDFLKKNNLRLKKLENELNKSKSKIGSLERELKENQQKLEAYMKQNEEQTKKLNELKNMKKSNDSQINNLNRQINNKDIEIQNLKKKCEEIENEITNKYIKIIKNYEDQLNTFKQNESNKIKELNEEKEKLINQLKLREENNTKNEKELKTNKDKINQLNAEKNQLKEIIKIKEDKINELEKKIQELEKIIDKLKSENCELLKNKKDLETEIEENSKSQNNSFLISSQSLKLNNSNYLEKPNNSKSNKKIIIIAKNKENENLNINREKFLKTEIIESRTSAEDELIKLKKETIRLKTSVKKLTSENNELRKNCKNLENQIELLNKKEIEMTNQNKNLNNKIENQNKIIIQYESKIKNYESEIENSNKNIDDLKKEIIELEKNSMKLKDIKMREKEAKNRQKFLEDKEDLLDAEFQKIQDLKNKISKYQKENNDLKNQNINLIKSNQNIQNEILKYQQMFSNFPLNNNNNLQQNNNMNQNLIQINQMNQNMIIPQNNQQNPNIIINMPQNQNQINFANNINNMNNNSNNMINYNIHLKKNSDPITLYSKPALIGLNNIGATCFMNSTLQCLSQTEALTNYFLKEKNKDKIINNNIAIKNNNEYQLAPVYYELIQKLWDKNGPKSFSPYNFMNRVNEMNSLFKKGEAGDAKDFIIFVLEQMHKELKRPLKSNNQDNLNIMPLNQYDKNNAFNNFFEEFKKETSILTDIFFGFNETTNVCVYCENVYKSKGLTYPICYNYGVFNVLIFPLEEVKNMKQKLLIQNNNNIVQINQVTLEECFLYNQKTDLFTGENKNYCNICKQLYDSNYTSRIFVSPNVLILILNRGKGNIYKIKLDFKEIIDITDFVLQKDKQRIKYSLYGVITHIGESGPNAHFVATCKSPVNGQWYRYNDALVSPINDYKKEVYDFANPYILFYKKL